MKTNWLATTPSEFFTIILSTVVVYSAILLYTRLAGLRSFSKISAADFAMTVAIGSLFASTISSRDPALLNGLLALGCLYTGQWALARVRRSADWTRRIIDNRPLLLVAHGEFIEENLQKANITRADMFAKFREANATDYQEIIAAVFETTGDISVVTARDSAKGMHPDFLTEVVDGEKVFR